ncbi:MAG: class I SAM-dependent rRNA methyltransferase [Parachlamydiaceae bacterium]
MSPSKVTLKPEKEKAILNRHHWIFSGAVAHLPKFTDGDLLTVYSHAGNLLGSAYFNRKSGIIGRMVSFDSTPPLEAIQKSLQASLSYRQQLFDPTITNGYRLVNGEGDCLPGLIIDCYRDTLVIQIGTLGMEKLKGFIVDWLVQHLQPKTIFEKSDSPSRKEEGLKPFSGLLYGTQISPVQILENGLKFTVDFVQGQKTGFFCDHRLMRQQIQTLAKGKSVLNCFAYSGGFSVYALAGGAHQVTSVELSEQALNEAKKNVALNGSKVDEKFFSQADVFDFLRLNPLDYQLIILDPPAFAKKQKDVITACRGYKDINRLALKKMPSNSWLLTCSCSFYVDEALFQKVVFQAAVEAGRKVRIVGKHLLAPDHPINICHPESDYLKSLLLYVE